MAKAEAQRVIPQWGPVQLGDRFCVWGGRLTEPRPLLDTEEIYTVAGRLKFVNFSLGLPWAQHALGHALRRGRGGTGKVQGPAWKGGRGRFQGPSASRGRRSGGWRRRKGRRR
eukprot:2718566-Pyramimonas_sp.AAC.1